MRSAILDYGPIEALKALVWGGLKPSHLSALEIGLRALITTSSVRVWPFHDGFGTSDASVSWPPIDDSALDYEFEYDNGRLPALATLQDGEEEALDRLADDLLSQAIGKKPEHFKPSDLIQFLPPSKQDNVTATLSLEDLESDETVNLEFVREMLREHLLTLVRFHRSGAVVFSESPLAKICKEHLFAKYPEGLFAELNPAYKDFIRKIVGPGLGATVPPLSALVLSRLSKRQEVAVAIRELREEYQASRDSLWDSLERMWTADNLNDQMKILRDLEGASASLFPAAFPQRDRFLETALSATLDLADARPVSAFKTMGSALLQMDEHTSRVSAFGFTKQLSSDLSKIQGSDKFLRRILARSEQIEFGLG
jgi:hypothetical protein